MNALRAARNLFDKINDVTGAIFKWTLIVIGGCLSFEVIVRYIFNNPTIWANDIAVQMLATLGCMGGGYAMLYNSHVRVDVFWDRWSIKVKAIVDIMTSLLFFIFICFLLYNSTKLAINSWAFNERATTVFALPLYPIKTMIIFGEIALLLQGFSKLIHDVIVLITGESENVRSMGY